MELLAGNWSEKQKCLWSGTLELFQIVFICYNDQCQLKGLV